jgi:hypothetical protein
LIASSEIRACSAALPRPAATSSAPTSLRSNPTACDSYRAGAAAHGRPGSARAGLPRRRSGKPGDRAQPARDRRPCPARGFHVTAETLDVCPPHGEQMQPVPHAPRGIHPQVERVGVTGQTGVAGQKPCQRGTLALAEQRFSHRHQLRAGNSSSGGHNDLRGSGRARPQGPAPAANEHRHYDRHQDTLERRFGTSSRAARRTGALIYARALAQAFVPYDDRRRPRRCAPAAHRNVN